MLSGIVARVGCLLLVAKNILYPQIRPRVIPAPLTHLEPRGRCQCDNDGGREYCCASRSRLPRACGAGGWLAQRVDSLSLWLPLDGALSLLLVVRHKIRATAVVRGKNEWICEPTASRPTVHTSPRRDYAKALITSPETLSPCFRNIQNPIDVLVGQGVLNNATERIAEWLERHLPGLDFIVDCIEPPIEEPKYGF